MSKEHKQNVRIINRHGPYGYVFLVTWIGALVYFMRNAKGLGRILFAIVEAFVWPGILLYHVLLVLKV